MVVFFCFFGALNALYVLCVCFWRFFFVVVVVVVVPFVLVVVVVAAVSFSSLL